MSPNIAGALVGFVVGLMGYLAIRLVASRIEQNGATAEPSRTAGLLRMVALADFILFIVLGYIVGPMIIEASN